jgi:hypothetical protein
VGLNQTNTWSIQKFVAQNLGYSFEYRRIHAAPPLDWGIHFHKTDQFFMNENHLYYKFQWFDIPAKSQFPYDVPFSNAVVL